MDERQLKKAVAEAVSAFAAAGKAPKKPLEFSKRLMIFAGALCLATWLVAAAAFFMGRAFPAELTQYTRWFFGAAVPGYLLKSGYENRAKIQNDSRAQNENRV